jgi:GH18 family chitinase
MLSALALLVVSVRAANAGVDVYPSGMAADGFSVASYLPEWRYEGANYDTICEHNSHLIIFSLEIAPDGHITALDRIPRDELMKNARVAADKHGTKLLICFGGNARSQGFSPMVAKASSRKKFLAELEALCEKYGFDGVDYNWEYPG